MKAYVFKDALTFGEIIEVETGTGFKAGDRVCLYRLPGSHSSVVANSTEFALTATEAFDKADAMRREEIRRFIEAALSLTTLTFTIKRPE